MLFLSVLKYWLHYDFMQVEHSKVQLLIQLDLPSKVRVSRIIKVSDCLSQMVITKTKMSSGALQINITIRDS